MIPDNRPFAIRSDPPERLRQALRRMHLIRGFEEGAEDSHARGLIHGTMHLSIRQEASAVATRMDLTDADKITSTHRGHGHCVAQGADVKTGNLGANGIVGGGLPIAVGAALSAKRLGRTDVTVCVFGDGANNQGAFHESLNMAAIWPLPVVFVCENNQYGMSTSTERSTAIARISDRAAASAMPGVTVDGNDVSAPAQPVQGASTRARAGEGPSLVENLTCRWRGPSKSDRNRYRSRDEIDLRMTRDPIARFRAELIAHGVLDAAAAAARVQAGLAFAKASPAPDLAALTAHVHAAA